MKMFEVKKSRKRLHGIVSLQVAPQEALRLIESLAVQIRNKSPNVGRWEVFLDDGRDFSIAVIPEAYDK